MKLYMIRVAREKRNKLLKLCVVRKCVLYVPYVLIISLTPVVHTMCDMYVIHNIEAMPKYFSHQKDRQILDTTKG